jgi:hypothetical protein
LTVNQYKVDRPYVVETRRGTGNGLTVTNYYFWVKNKTTPAASKKLGVKQLASLLTHPNDVYCVPQVLKYASQVDERPNRYALISIENLGLYVRADDTYKIRFKNNPHLRQSDGDLDLKNVHEEWVLIRPQQPQRIPQKLWDLATDTVVGVNQIGEALPNSSLALYDQKTGGSASYGPRRGQILTDTLAARAAIKYTILNTRVMKYVDDELLPDYIEYAGFDVSALDARLATAAGARELMAELWRFAKPKQVNELFFALLEDGIAKNLQMPDFFKTSYVAVNDIRTVTFASDTLASNVQLVISED